MAKTQTVATQRASVLCAFCHSTGVYPHSRQTCIACGGAGVSSVHQPNKTCPHCLGTGIDPQSEVGFYCLTCYGTGMVKEEN